MRRADIAAIKRRPTEEWHEYVARLERAHLQVMGEQKEKEADALEQIGEEQSDYQLKVAARAQRAAAQEFYKAVAEIDRGSR